MQSKFNKQKPCYLRDCCAIMQFGVIFWQNHRIGTFNTLLSAVPSMKALQRERLFFDSSIEVLD